MACASKTALRSLTASPAIFLMVLEGSLVVHSRIYEPLELNKGDALYCDAGAEHSWTSKGEVDALVLWVLTPV